jgi:hypothetical protein
MWRGAPVAVKIFEQVELDQVDNSTLHTLRREAEMLEKLSNHPCVVSFVGAVTKGDVAIQGALFFLCSLHGVRANLF